MNGFKIIIRKHGATLDNPDRDAVEFNFVRDGQNYGGRTYDLTIWNEDEAKAHFIKWCGY